MTYDHNHVFETVCIEGSMLLRIITPTIFSVIVCMLLSGCGMVSAALHSPTNLPSVETDQRVHYEPGADAYAKAVATVLPGAISRIETAMGRPFAKPFVIAVYESDSAYAAANGSGNPHTIGTTYFDRITLSPRLWRDEPDRIEDYLAHELSHEHLWGNLGTLHYVRVPAWFQEGLAVWASMGGGAQHITIAEATQAIKSGQTIAVPDGAPFLWLSRFSPPPNYQGPAPAHMAYRQAGMFVTYLHDADPARFKAFLDRLYAGEGFKDAFEASFHESVDAQWSEFTEHQIRGNSTD